ncbi:uncharacterized protein LACBIDRAFT_330496 [Laccaria bicolor S238N-H82]|uniref:Predicted protein n=1 Tax=Laccaria bicolor (strain S238N-H82 / ATCC MYA-4686) TaxID=486041 RepID=B0DLG6_LACBS|nr:uncharacterized protein LACBIDRAFT_330496 [Laccaria bicolor S238N-H82]EDR04563.1 predicted protein [Laccaria bicolor S238N-H82]|eukprot:XP_001884735.1 predicted protein [Laccaria bicolor S238N-H82]
MHVLKGPHLTITKIVVFVILVYSQASYIQQPHPNASVQGWHLPWNVISFRTATFFCGGSIYSYYSVANVAGAWGGLQRRPKNRALNIVFGAIRLLLIRAVLEFWRFHGCMTGISYLNIIEFGLIYMFWSVLALQTCKNGCRVQVGIALMAQCRQLLCGGQLSQPTWSQQEMLAKIRGKS